MFNKLSLKIGLLFFVFMLIIEVFVYFILYTNIANERIDEVMNSLLARANTHSTVLANNFNSSTLEHGAIMASASEFAVMITAANGIIIMNSDHVEKEMLEVIDHKDHKNIPNIGKVVEQRWSERQDIAVDSPMTIDGEHQGQVFMFANTNLVKNTLNH